LWKNIAENFPYGKIFHLTSLVQFFAAEVCSSKCPPPLDRQHKALTAGFIKGAAFTSYLFSAARPPASMQLVSIDPAACSILARDAVFPDETRYLS
jgi:hypothetical protein